MSPVRPPVLGAFGRASRSAGSATSSYGHRDRHGRESRDMGPVGRCSDVPGLRQAFPRPSGADPGYVEHRPVSGAGVPKARCRTLRTLPGICAFAPCAAHRHEPSKPPNLGNASRRFACFPTTPYMCARQHGVPSIYSIVPPNDGSALRHGHHFEPVDFVIDHGRGHHDAYSAGSCQRTYARACGCRQRPRRHREELIESERGWSGREAFVTMMQTADLGQGNDRSGPGRLNGSSIRCVLADRQVGP